MRTEQVNGGQELLLGRGGEHCSKIMGATMELDAKMVMTILRDCILINFGKVSGKQFAPPSPSSMQDGFVLPRPVSEDPPHPMPEQDTIGAAVCNIRSSSDVECQGYLKS